MKRIKYGSCPEKRYRMSRDTCRSRKLPVQRWKSVQEGKKATFDTPTYESRELRVRHPHGQQGNEPVVQKTTAKMPRNRNDGEAGQVPTHMYPSPVWAHYPAVAKLCFTSLTNVAYVHSHVHVLYLAFD
jgi:hypothetical protein